MGAVILVEAAVPVVVARQHRSDVMATDENALHEAVDEVVVQRQTDVVVGVDADLGQIAWRCEQLHFDAAPGDGVVGGRDACARQQEGGEGEVAHRGGGSGGVSRGRERR